MRLNKSSCFDGAMLHLAHLWVICGWICHENSFICSFQLVVNKCALNELSNKCGSEDRGIIHRQLRYFKFIITANCIFPVSQYSRVVETFHFLAIRFLFTHLPLKSAYLITTAVSQMCIVPLSIWRCMYHSCCSVMAAGIY